LVMNFFWTLFTKLYLVLRFPSHTLFWSIFSNGSTALFFAGLIVNCCFYALLTERIFWLIKIFKK
jgi:hypothetical protein